VLYVALQPPRPRWSPKVLIEEGLSGGTSRQNLAMSGSLSGGFSGGERENEFCIFCTSLTTTCELPSGRSDQFDANSIHAVEINREIRPIMGKQE
jgi:hypothetical protein